MKQKTNKLVVADICWAETIPEWLKKEVEFERLALGLASIIKPTDKVGDAEAALYLFTASLASPLSHELTEAYLYLVAKLMKRQGRELPDFMEEKLTRGLSHDEEWELENLKKELYRARGGQIQHPLLDAMRQLKNETIH